MKIEGFYKRVTVIALPIMLQNLMQTFINMLDTIMVGKLGATEIAAVGLGNQVFFVLNMMLFGISSGGSVFIAQFWGKKDFGGIKRSLGIMLFLSLVVSAIFTAGVLVMPRTIIGWYSNDAAVVELGAQYVRIVGLSYIMTAISFAFTLAFRSTEHVHLPMFTTGASLVTNAVFNYVFIFVFGWGVQGAAAATVISRAVEMIFTLAWSYVHHFEACGSLKTYFSFDRGFVAKFIKVALPVLINETFWGLGITMQNSIFSHTDTNAYTAFSITGTISQLTWVFFIGLGNGMGVIIGKFIGSGELEKARAYARRSVWFMPAMGAAIGLLLLPLSKTLPFFFNVDASIIGNATKMLLVLMCLYPICAFNMNWIVGVCRAGGDTIFSAICEVSCLWLVSIPLGACAAFIWKLEPIFIYLCLQSEQVVKVALGLPRVLSGKWLHDVTK
jgi:putative MATE family efflux protein